MKKPSILIGETKDTEQQLDATTASVQPAETDHVEEMGATSPVPIAEPALTVTLETGETLRKGHDSRIYIGDYQIWQVTPHGLPTQVRCIMLQPDETTTEYAIGVNNLLLVSIGSSYVSIETEAQWFSAYMYARSVLNQIVAIFSETSVGSALEYAWGNQKLLKVVTQAKEVSSLFPVQFPDAASLFAACIAMNSLLAAIIIGCERMDIGPFLTHVMGGQAFLEAFSQLKNAWLQLPGLVDPLPYTHSQIGNITNPGPVSIIHKEEEAERLHGEIVDNKNPLTQLYLAMLLGATSFLTFVLQPDVAPFAACLLPLAGLSIAFKIAAYDLRPGQINFYLRRVLLSPWEIIRRILFDGSQPSEQELAVLKEQHIFITEELLKAAQALKPPFQDMQSTANRLAILLFEGAAIGVLVYRLYGAIAKDDLGSFIQVLIALIISSVATFYSFKVLKRKRVR